MDDGASLGLPREEVLRDAVAVVGDDAVGDVEDLRGGAVVLVEDDGTVRRETDEQVRPGAAPLVDGLVGIADDEQVPVLRAQPLHEVPVVGVAVLGLVHHDVIQLVLPPGAGVGELVEEIDRQVHQVVEVQRVVLHLPADIVRQFGTFPHAVGDLRTGQHVGFDIAVERLFYSDSVQELLYGLFGTLDAEFIHRLLGEGLAVLLVEDGEGFREAQAVDLLPEELDAEAVEGADEVVVVAAVDHAGDALPHFRGRLVGEGQAEDVRRVDAQDIDDVGVAVGQGLGLARPGAGDDADAPLRGAHRLSLPAVETVEDGVAHRTGVKTLAKENISMSNFLSSHHMKPKGGAS